MFLKKQGLLDHLSDGQLLKDSDIWRKLVYKVTTSWKQTPALVPGLGVIDQH